MFGFFGIRVWLESRLGATFGAGITGTSKVGFHDELFYVWLCGEMTTVLPVNCNLNGL